MHINKYKQNLTFIETQLEPHSQQKITYTKCYQFNNVLLRYGRMTEGVLCKGYMIACANQVLCSKIVTWRKNMAATFTRFTQLLTIESPYRRLSMVHMRLNYQSLILFIPGSHARTRARPLYIVYIGRAGCSFSRKL